MKTVKCIIFIVGVFLVNFVGGVPNDSRNLFITQAIFLAPYLVDYYNLLQINNSILKWIIRIIWIAGILTISANILGIAGVITVVSEEIGYRVIINPEFYSPFSINLSINRYLLIVGCVYASIFMGTITLDYLHNLNESILKNKKEKANSKNKKEKANKGKEMVENVHPR